MGNSNHSSTVIKALNILNCFADDRHELGITEISSLIEMPVSSVYRLIQSLEYEGLLSQDRETKKYYLGPAFLLYSKKCMSYPLYERIATHFADQLGSVTGENVNVSIYSCGQICHIYTCAAQHVLRPSFPLNTPFPACTTSVGRVFLSHMSPAGVKWIYENTDSRPDMPLEDFIEELAQYRRQGYALDDEVFNAGLRCVGAPIYRPDGTIIFAMSVSAPRARMTDARYEEAAREVVHFAALATEEISSLV